MTTKSEMQTALEAQPGYISKIVPWLAGETIGDACARRSDSSIEFGSTKITFKGAISTATVEWNEAKKKYIIECRNIDYNTGDINDAMNVFMYIAWNAAVRGVIF